MRGEWGATHGLPNLAEDGLYDPEKEEWNKDALKARLVEAEREHKNDSVLAQELVHGADQFEVVATVSLVNLVSNPETFSEATHPGKVAWVEFAALLAGMKSRNSNGPTELHPLKMDELLEVIERMFLRTMTMWTLSDLIDNKAKEEPAMAFMRAEVRMDSLMVRFAGYESHVSAALRQIFGPIDSEVQTELGFSPIASIDACAKLTDLVNKRITLRTREVADRRKQILKDVKRSRKRGRPLGEEIPLDAMEALMAIPPSEARAAVDLQSGYLLLSPATELLLVTPKDLESCGLPLDQAMEFLKAFAVQCGEVSEAYSEPAATHPFNKRAFLGEGDEYLLIVPQGVPWVFRTRLEELLNPDLDGRGHHKLWRRYVKLRSDYVEERGLDLISGIPTSCVSERSLEYSFVDVDGAQVDGEVDGLVHVDSALFLIEAKGKPLTPAARRGGERRMVTDLKRNVDEAYIQTDKARQFVEHASAPTFTRRNGSHLVLDMAGVRHVYEVVITLDSLDPFVTNLQRMREAGILEGEGYPWVIGLNELEVIAEHVEGIGQLAHYLERRLKINETGRIHAHDELDWFGHYLARGLYFKEELESDLAMLFLPSYTGKFDDYYFYKEGLRRSPAEAPRQEMPEMMRTVLRELECKAQPGFLDVCLVLTEVDWEGREEFAADFEEMRANTLKDCYTRTHAFVCSEFGGALMLTVGLSRDRDRVAGKLDRDMTRLSASAPDCVVVGIGSFADRQDVVHVVQVLSPAAG